MTSFDPPNEPDWGDDPDFEDALANESGVPDDVWPEPSSDLAFDADVPSVSPADLDLDLDLPAESEPEPEPHLVVDDGVSAAADDDVPTIDLGLDDVDLSLEPDHPEAAADLSAWPDATVGLLSHDTLVSFAATSGVEITTDALEVTMGELGITVDDHGLAARDAARVFDELGLDVLVDNGSIDDLGDLVGDGSVVLVGGSDPSGAPLSLTLVGVDLVSELVSLVDENGVRFEVGFDDFEEAWESSTNEILRSADGPSAISIRLAIDPFPVDLGLV